MGEEIKEEIPERDGQLYCSECKDPIGLTDQPAAYPSMSLQNWMCKTHRLIEYESVVKS